MGNLAAEDITVTASASSALVASRVVLNAPGIVHSVSVQLDPSLAAGNYWILVLDAASLPSNGTVTPTHAGLIDHANNKAELAVMFDKRTKFAAGCVVALSTTGPGTLTIGSASMVVGAEVSA